MEILDLMCQEQSQLTYEYFEFSDGQPHLRITSPLKEWEHVQVITRLATPKEFVVLGLALDVLRRTVKGRISVNISYVLGARMDRAISAAEPFTLKVLANMLNVACAGASDIRILDPHSQVLLDLVPRSTGIGVAALVQSALAKLPPDTLVVCPDAGAVPRLVGLGLAPTTGVVYCEKTRDPNTGALSGFAIKQTPTQDYLKDKPCLIVDDLCDGGGTFVGLAKVLRERGASSVNLCVTHGIFSKGVAALEGIDSIFVTDSYGRAWDAETVAKYSVHVSRNYLQDWVKGPK